VKAATSGYHRAFFVRFDRAAPLWRSEVSGRLELRIDNRLLSGLTGAALFSPLGRRRDDLACTMHTVIKLNFTLSLDSLVVIQPYGMTTKRDYSGPVELETVLDLAARLSARGYYVKQLVEHTRGALHREHAHEVDRSWTVAGRYYRGVFPVNFEVEVSCPGNAQRARSPEVVELMIRLDAHVSRGPTLDMLRGTQTSLIRICDEVFGRPPVPAPLIGPAATGPTPGTSGFSRLRGGPPQGEGGSIDNPDQ